MNFQPLFESVGGSTFILRLTIQPSLDSISYMHTRVHVKAFPRLDSAVKHTDSLQGEGARSGKKPPLPPF